MTQDKGASAQPTASDVADAVEAWHLESDGRPLHEYLGWTMAEYVAWCSDPDKVPARPLGAEL